MKAFVPSTRAFPERHTGVEIAQKLGEIAAEFGVKKKVSCAVHDQASNMQLSMELLNSERGWKSLKCTAHCLQLCVNAGFSIPAIDQLLGAAHKLVAHFHHSVVATEAIKCPQKQMGVPLNKLIGHVQLGGIPILTCL